MTTLMNGQSHPVVENGNERKITPPKSAPPVSNGLKQDAVQHNAGERPATGQGRGVPAAPHLEQPLLIVAGGGTGRDIATRTKATMIEVFGAVPDNVRIVAFDSARDPISCIERRNGRVVELEQGVEFIHLDRVPLAGIKRNPQAHKEIVERMGPLMARIHRPIIDDGGAQERAQGLITLLWNAPRVEQALGHAVRRLAERSNNVNHQLDARTGINVVLVGSTGGGQGSGTVWDLTYLTREKLAELGDLGDASRVMGLFVLPSAFVGVNGPNLQPNTQAFFLELNSLQKGDGFVTRYPGNLQIQNMERPFHHVMLLDGVDEHGKAWPNREDVYAMAAQALVMLFASDVGAREFFIAINELGILQNESATGHGTYLSTVGQAVIRFPAAQIVQRCARRQALAATELLLAQPAQTEGEKSALGRIATAAATRLRQSTGGAPYQTQVQAPAALEKLAPEEIPAQARTLVANFFQRRIYEGIFVEMRAQAATLQAEQQAVWASQLERMLNEGKLRLGQMWLQQIATHLAQEAGGLANELATLAKQVERGQGALDSAGHGLDQAAAGFLLWRQAQTRNALSLYLIEASQLAHLRLEQQVQQVTANLVGRFLSWVDEQTNALATAITQLERAQAQLVSGEDELARNLAVQREIMVADPALIEQIYARYQGSAHTDVRTLIGKSAGVLAWGRQEPDELVAALTTIARQPFAPVLELSVEDALAARWDDRSAQQWVERLKNMAAGAWNLDRALLPSGGAELARFLTLGVPDANHTIFANCGYTLVSTHDRERIVALSTVYGASYDMLKPARGWQSSYTAAAGRVPLHILPQFLRTNDDQSTQAFVLGIIFGLIYNQATWFYYRPEDTLAQPLRLGQGLENVVAEFGGRTALHEELMVRVVQRIATEGTVKALETIDAYVNGTGGDETNQKLRRAARSYADELRRSRRAVRAEG